jgi:hypothetical protein
VRKRLQVQVQLGIFAGALGGTGTYTTKKAHWKLLKESIVWGLSPGYIMSENDKNTEKNSTKCWPEKVTHLEKVMTTLLNCRTLPQELQSAGQSSKEKGSLLYRECVGQEEQPTHMTQLTLVILPLYPSEAFLNFPTHALLAILTLPCCLQQTCLLSIL